MVSRAFTRRVDRVLSGLKASKRSFMALLKMVFLVTTSATFVWDVARRVLRFASLIAFLLDCKLLRSL